MNTLSEKEEECIRDVVRKKEFSEPLLVLNVHCVLNPKKPAKSNVLALSNYRIFLFDCDKLGVLKGKFTETHILDLHEIAIGDKSDEIVLRVVGREEEKIIIKTDNVGDVTKIIYNNYTKVTQGWSTKNMCRFKCPVPEKKTSTGFAGGLIDTYFAYCNKRGTLPLKEFSSFVKDLSKKGNQSIDFSQIPGFNSQGGILETDIPTIAYTLQNNNYFRSIKLNDLSNKDTIEFLSIVLKHNSKISHISAKNSSGTNVEGSEQLGVSLSSNHLNRIQVLQLSSVKFKESAVFTMAQALHKLPHALKVLDLDSSIPSSRAIGWIISAFRANPGMALSLEELNLSNNRMDADCISLFTEWSNDCCGFASLSRLSVANTGIVCSEFFNSRLLSRLSYLDVSDNRIEKSHSDGFVKILSDSVTLEVLRMSGCFAPIEFLQKLTTAIVKNDKLSKFCLDISRNELLPKSIQMLGDVFHEHKASNIAELDISDAGFKSKLYKTMITTLSPNLSKLSFNGVLQPTAQTEDFMKTLGMWLNARPALVSLSLAGHKDKQTRGFIVPLFTYLRDNHSLKELDISNNNIGDVAFSILCKSLRKNTSLSWLSADGNSITHQGYMCLRLALQKNKTLLHYETPLEDTAKDIKIMSIMSDIITMLSRREEQYKRIPNVFSFDRDWSGCYNELEGLSPVPEHLRHIASIYTNGFQIAKSNSKALEEMQNHEESENPNEETSDNTNLSDNNTNGGSSSCSISSSKSSSNIDSTTTTTTSTTTSLQRSGSDRSTDKPTHNNDNSSDKSKSEFMSATTSSTSSTSSTTSTSSTMSSKFSTNPNANQNLSSLPISPRSILPPTDYPAPPSKKCSTCLVEFTTFNDLNTHICSASKVNSMDTTTTSGSGSAKSKHVEATPKASGKSVLSNNNNLKTPTSVRSPLKKSTSSPARTFAIYQANLGINNNNDDTVSKDEGAIQRVVGCRREMYAQQNSSLFSQRAKRLRKPSLPNFKEQLDDSFPPAPSDIPAPPDAPPPLLDVQTPFSPPAPGYFPSPPREAFTPERSDTVSIPPLPPSTMKDGGNNKENEIPKPVYVAITPKTSKTLKEKDATKTRDKTLSSKKSHRKSAPVIHPNQLPPKTSK
eukprot:TRINITY_DN7882_c0_g1_i1.p1 TRINITY_DN7882_c0_g1~~TRINITY_DN7882_c0_g1_i1.p1  ORF type:complete len:1121 (-),score=316.58 TRINITY_DN7882_c0_g1_i1:178-3540(-)